MNQDEQILQFQKKIKDQMIHFADKLDRSILLSNKRLEKYLLTLFPKSNDKGRVKANVLIAKAIEVSWYNPLKFYIVKYFNQEEGRLQNFYELFYPLMKASKQEGESIEQMYQSFCKNYTPSPISLETIKKQVLEYFEKNFKWQTTDWFYQALKEWLDIEDGKMTKAIMKEEETARKATRVEFEKVLYAYGFKKQNNMQELPKHFASVVDGVLSPYGINNPSEALLESLYRKISLPKQS